MIVDSFLSLSGAELESKLPHAGNMCLLDHVANITDEGLSAWAIVRRVQHPLSLGEDSVSSVVLIEYAAQAAAVHLNCADGLLFGKGVPVFLATVKLFQGVSEFIEEERVRIDIELEVKSDAGACYSFRAHKEAKNAQGQHALSERAVCSGKFVLMAAGEAV